MQPLEDTYGALMLLISVSGECVAIHSDCSETLMCFKASVAMAEIRGACNLETICRVISRFKQRNI